MADVARAVGEAGRRLLAAVGARCFIVVDELDCWAAHIAAAKGL